MDKNPALFSRIRRARQTSNTNSNLDTKVCLINKIYAYSLYVHKDRKKFKHNDKMKENIITQSIPGGFAVIASSFIIQSLEHMIPWLIVSFSVIICDLAFGVRKSLLMNEEVRFSGAIRRTMGKMVTYFAFVCMVVMINIASGDKWNIDIYSCLFVCFIEFCSIISNILKPKGYDFNVLKALGIFCKKVFNVDKEDVSEIITKDKEENK